MAAPPESERPAGSDSDDPVAEAILALLTGRGAGKSISPEDAARAFAAGRARPGAPPDLWRRYLPAVRQQALNLARRGRIRILRKGKAVDPHAPVKGVIRLALPAEADDGVGNGPAPPLS
jgi:hypothetical protein